MQKAEVLRIIDGVMNNREIDSIRNAILAIRDQVIEYPEDEYSVRLELRSDNELCCATPYFDGARYIVIDTLAKVDTGEYGMYWYE